MREAGVSKHLGAHRYRTLFLSDLHLGTRGCQAHLILDMLRHVEADTIYLVGDILDGWRLRSGWYWPQAHNDVMQKLLRKVRRGARMVFVPGNHDEFARQFFGLTFGGIEIKRQAIHTITLGTLVWRFRDECFKGRHIQKRGVRARRVRRNWLEVRFGNCGFAVSSNAGCRDLRNVLRSGWLRWRGSRWSKAGQRRWPFVV